MYLSEKTISSETLEKYDSSVNEMHSLAEVEAFSYGFRLGVKLMIEAVITNPILTRHGGDLVLAASDI